MEIKKNIFSLVALLFATPLFAQFDFPSMSPASAAMGGVSVALDDDGSSIYNIAALASSDRPFVDVAVRQDYFIEGLGYASVAAAIPTGYGAWAASFINYGDVDYHERQLSLSYALPLEMRLRLGAAFHYLNSCTSDPYYDPLNRFTFSLALQYLPSESFTVGFKAFNPVAVVAENGDAVRIPALFNLGVAYWLRDELLVVAEVEKNLYRDPSLRFGLEYVFLEYYALRTGVSTAPVVYSFGMGMQKVHFGADIAILVHQLLGFTTHLSLHYRF